MTARDLLIPLPPNAPQSRGRGFSRWLGRCVLRLGGWRMRGAFPDLPKLVIIVAPHTSNWDGFWGLAAKMALGVEIRVLGKAQLFWWPLGVLLRGLGAIPVERGSPHGVVAQAVELIACSGRCWFVLAPEGTRKPAPRWKTGFWKIASAAHVPIVPAYLHYPDKVIGIGELFVPGDDMQADIRALREWYVPWMGKRPENMAPLSAHDGRAGGDELTKI